MRRPILHAPVGHALLVLIISGVGGLPALAQDTRPTAQATARERALATLPAEVFAQVAAQADAAEALGIPGEILFNKALEGAAKRVPPARLIPGVAQYADRLREARTAFMPLPGTASEIPATTPSARTADGPLLVAAADALQRGVTPELLRGLGEESPERTPVAVLTLADLVDTGIGGDRALSLVREAMLSRAREQQMLDLAAEVRRLLRAGRTPGDAVDDLRRGLRRRRGGGSPPVAPGALPRRRRGGG